MSDLCDWVKNHGYVKVIGDEDFAIKKAEISTEEGA